MQANETNIDFKITKSRELNEAKNMSACYLYW